MMLPRLQIFLLVIVVLLLLWVIGQVRRRKLDLRYTLSWLLLIVVLLLLVMFPQLLRFVSDLMGIQSQMNTLFVCGFGFSLIIIYTLTTAVSKQSEEIKRLTQKVALLEKMQGEKESE